MPYFNIYKYGDVYKIIWFNSNIQDNIEKHDKNYLIDIAEGIKQKKAGNKEYFKEQYIKNFDSKEKTENNIIRAKSAVTEYALCNEWEYFVTLTIDGKKQDRYNLDSYIHDLGIWIGNYNKKYGTKLKYILIPEQHKDGAWHCHGFFMGISKDSIITNKNGYCDLPYYKNRFGYISLDKIKNKDAASFYITKYINKDMSARCSDLGSHLYYCSKGLKRKELYIASSIEIDDKYKRAFYRNEFCNILWCDKVPDLIMDKYKEYIKEIESEQNVASDSNVNYAL